MLWCLCFGSKPTKVNMKQEQEQEQKQKQEQNLNDNSPSSSAEPARALSESQTVQDSEDETLIFTYRELATATNNFREESIIGRGGFGCVYKGTLECTGQEVAVKMLDHSGVQGEKEFLVEVLMLSLLRHENLMRLIGYCAEGDQRLLVYEYMPLGSVEDHMHNKKCSGQKALDWSTRMQIAAGAAKGLSHLHNVAGHPPVIYRDLKTANILLDHGFKPKLSDFGLAKFGPTGDVTHVTTKVMGTLGYCAPEYAKSGKLTIKSDIYSFGVVMLELITGRKALLDPSMGPNCFLGDWALALFKKDKIKEIVDPMLTIKGRYMESTLRKALEVAFMCLREEANARPTISEVVIALNYIVKCTTTSKKKKKARVGSGRGGGEGEGEGGGGDSEKKGGTSSSSPETPRILSGNNEEERNVDLDRQRAVAEAKNWAESLRRKSTEASSPDS